MVEGIEEFTTKLERIPIQDLDVFDSGQIPVVIPGAEHAATALGAKVIDGSGKG